jgi:hypothetical protein
MGHLLAVGDTEFAETAESTTTSSAGPAGLLTVVLFLI